MIREEIQKLDETDIKPSKSDTKIATSPTKDGIIKMLNRYWYSKHVRLEKVSDKPELYAVFNAKGRVDRFYVKKLKRGFYAMHAHK